MDKENYVKRNHHHSSPPHLFTQSHTEPHRVLNHSTHFTTRNSPHTAVQPQKPWSISGSTAPQPILYGAGISNGRPLVPSPAISPMGQGHIRNFTQSSVGGGVGMMRVVPLSVLGSQRGTGVYIPRTYFSQTAGNRTTTGGLATNKHVPRGPRVGKAQNKKMENVTPPPPPPPPQLETQHHLIGGAHISQNEISVGSWRNAAAAADGDGGMGEEEERLNNEISKLPEEWTY